MKNHAILILSKYLCHLSRRRFRFSWLQIARATRNLFEKNNFGFRADFITSVENVDNINYEIECYEFQKFK